MPTLRIPRTIAFLLVAFAFQLLLSARCSAQAALFMEEPYGFFGTVNPTGHGSVFCARLRRDADKIAPLPAGRDGCGDLPLQRCERL